MNIDLADYKRKANEAIKAFWRKREAARRKQSENGRSDQGERAGVTAGKNMDGFLWLVKDIVHRNGLGHAEICLERRVLTLPGYFRPTKLWDMLVLSQGRLIAAVEFKSQVGPSFGNNFNNRAEEAIGNAVDLWTAFREGALGESAQPFIGWLMLLEDCERSRLPIRDAEPHFPIFPEFNGTSYADRYALLCRKLMRERLYTATSVLLTPRSAIDTGGYSEISKHTGLKSFVTTLAGHIAVEALKA